MSARHVFRDEWLVRAAGEMGVAPETVDAMRARLEPWFSAAVLAGNADGAARLNKAVLAVFRIRCLPDPLPPSEKMAMLLVPEKLCRMDRLVPLRINSEKIEIAMENPTDLNALDAVRAFSGRTPIPVYGLPAQIDALLTRAFDPEQVVYNLIDRINDESSVELISDAAAVAAEDKEVKGPVVRLINSIIAKAVAMRASDIHLEHDERSSAVRYRIDGSLKTVMTLPKYVGAGPAVSRLKIMAKLDISDHLRPQDGRAKLLVDGVEIGLRVSTLPTNHGEKIVIRILDKRTASVPFDKLGLRPEIAERLKAMLGSAQGCLLVTGPTGSGKTTMLYSILGMLRGDDTNIVTVEDPIEYKLDGINQVQVQDKQGLTFAAVLRSVLRQDPDVILVGEIRDRETAEVAVQAAQTGHLVLSTLHTNDSVSALTRLADMGIEEHKLGPALLGIVAQRLVRRLCPACRHAVPTETLDSVVAGAMRRAGLKPELWEPKGCTECDFVGYKGRLALVELLEITPEVRDRISAGLRPEELVSFALQRGALKPLIDDALRQAASGATSLAEIAPHVRFDELEKIKPVTAPAVPAAPAAPVSGAALPTTGVAGARVLVADDDETIRMVIRMVLEKSGYEVIEAVDGREALVKVLSESPAMLVVDLMMPKVNGHEVIRAVRIGMGLKIPIVMITADSDDKSQETALNLGADDYVVKPVKPALLAARVNAAFRRYG
jgi:type II secretory ATPase GspE/PulE/Tfp pilus assembly ATPase PilB-like protein